MGSTLSTAQALLPLEAVLLKALHWRLNEPCAFDWATSVILTMHPKEQGTEPSAGARDMLLRASTVLDLVQLHPRAGALSEMAVGIAAACVAGVPQCALRPALQAAGVGGLLKSAAYVDAARLVGACSAVCPPLEHHCLVEAAMGEFHPSEFVWLQSHCEESKALVAALQ
jgi:hypothetical protein